ncbi:MAG: polyphosphate kinase 1, partial [Spirochaetes bacterium]|nr:polyphosphate kinase 1 [Spirochaetota bacterium]
SLNILINLKEQKKEEDLFAVIPVPSTNRFIPIPGDDSNQKFIYIEELIKLFADTIFKGYDIIQTCTFRVTRDAELSIDEEDAVDLLSEIEVQLKKRAKGTPIRLEIESSANNKLVEYLSQKIKFREGFYFSIDGPLDLSSFFDIVSINGFDHLKQEIFHPVPPKEFQDQKINIFNIISEKDRLIHLPYESFDPVIRFIEEAALDKNVLAIKLTLYRTSGDSPIISALKKAAENGKQVTVLVELKARFDEAQNIIWAKQLEKAGCHVVYGLVGLKTHCKMALVVRDEEDGIKRYLHLSTGNYNEKTAKIYTDIGLFTAKKSFGRDASSIFNLLTGFSDPPRWKKLVCAPLDLRDFFLEKIDIEIKNVKNGGKGKIIAKMNSLIDTKIIEALYKASKVGVNIQLIVRGMCRLRPQVKGLSENISIISVVDRFLEHSRIYYFNNSGEENVYLSSADWMERNFDGRVEALFPIEDADLIKEIKKYLEITLKDNQKARILQQDGMYIRKKQKNNEEIINSQKEIYNYILSNNKTPNKTKQTLFIPKMNPEEEKNL